MKIEQTHPTRKVLIIEDDHDTATAIQYLIELYSHSVCEVIADPYEALVTLAEKHFDFIFVDEKLPGMTGSTILKMLDQYFDKDPNMTRNGNCTQFTPVVLMSGEKKNLDKNFKLRNFNLIRFIEKSDLPKFLSVNFAS